MNFGQFLEQARFSGVRRAEASDQHNIEAEENVLVTPSQQVIRSFGGKSSKHEPATNEKQTN